MSKKCLLIGLLFLLLQNFSKAQTIDYSHFNKGIEFKNKGDYPSAILSFEKFLQTYPFQYPEAYFQRGKTYLHLNKLDEAILDLEKVLKLDQINKDAPYALGKIFFRQKKNQLALKYFTKSIQLNPLHALSFNDRGLVKCQLRNYNSALGDFLRATELDPTFAMAFNNAGAARYFKQDIAKPTSKDLREAKAYFSKAIQKNPTLALAYRNRALMNILTKNNDNAILDIKKAKELNPSDAMTVFYLGIIYADQLKLQKAFDTFREALKMNPQLSIVHEEMGNLYKNTKQYEFAIYQYHLAKTVRPDVGNLYKGLLDYRTALVYAEQNNKSKMYNSLKKARKNGAFRDQQLYRDFLKAKEFKSYRMERPFRSFQKSLRKEKRDNKFLNPDLGWFRMR